MIKPAFVRISCRAAVSGSAGRADVHDRSTHCPVDVKLTVRGFFRLNGARPRETALDGASVIETTWHNVTAWEGKTLSDLDKITVGTPVFVRGRLRSQKYLASDGTERTSMDVIANLVETIDENVAVQYG